MPAGAAEPGVAFGRFRPFGVGGLLGACLFALLTYWRVRSLRLLLAHAAQVPGEIAAISRSMFPRRGRYTYQVVYTYRYAEQDYRRSCLVKLASPTPVVQPGEHVNILLHPEQPRRALVPVLHRE
ncbi:MAG: DUF3592 domain-containing protein [Blastochloris sp.]|nr:DUF3592 domain-containing protein [Blastochloris sp.]